VILRGGLPAVLREHLAITQNHEGSSGRDRLRECTLAEMAADILATAPPHVAVAGISMGSHIGLEIMRQAPGRVRRLALLNTSTRPDTPEQVAQRHALVTQARN
jgi:pimeloyl-ACP methyl ester carboxylesterase